jgi:hypothetical protein
MRFPQRFALFIVGVLSLPAGAQARIANPYPVAFLRQGDVYILESADNWKPLTKLGDVGSLCWVDPETICFSREIRTGLLLRTDWQGIQILRDLFTVSRSGGRIQQWTVDHFTTEPAPASMPNRVVFTHKVPGDTLETEIWETIRPLIRNRSLGIRGHLPDSSPDQRWTAATLGTGFGGVGIYRYPTNDAYRKIEGDLGRPRFSPDGKTLAYLNREKGKNGIWGYTVPDGEPRRLLAIPKGFDRILDFGWTKDGSGFILVLQDEKGASDIYYYELDRKNLNRLTQLGDVKLATAWH